METGKIEYTRQWCKYEFSRDEMHEIAETLAIKTQEFTQLGQRVRAGWAQGGSIRMVQALGGAQ